MNFDVFAALLTIDWEAKGPRFSARQRTMGYDGLVALERCWGAAPVLLALLTVLVFFPGLSDEFTWDDNGLIRSNENIQEPERYGEALTSHFWNISADDGQANEIYNHLYRPIVTFAYIVQFRIFGLHAIGYRAVSLALHVLCCVLAFFWLRRRLPAAGDAQQLLAVSLGTAIFAFHPSRAEAVSWISGSPELWMCALVLLAALALDSKRSWLAGLLLAAALFAKETAIVAAPLLLVDRFLLHGRRERSVSIALTAPIVVALLVRIWVVDVELPSGTAGGAIPRVLSSFGLYAQQILSPWNPTAFPGMRIHDCERGEILNTAWWFGGTLLAAVLVALGIAAFRSRVWRPALADALWIAVPLMPVVNLIDLGSRSLTADRFLYLPMLGVSALVARGLLWTFAKRPSLGRPLSIATAVLVLGLALVTSLHSRVFASSSSLWEYEVIRNPDNPFALRAVGTARTRAGLRMTGLAYLEHAHDVVTRTCVEADQVRAAKDLAWALALRTGPDDRAGLLALQHTYERVGRDGVFEYSGSPSWLLGLSAEEASDFVAEDLQYALPRATVEARLGDLSVAERVLLDQNLRSDSLHPLSRNLQLRLVAAQGGIEDALAELMTDPTVADAESLRSVLGTLHEVFSRTRPATGLEVSLARYALGFGQASNDIEGLPVEARTILDALHAYETDAPVDIASLEPLSVNSRELGRFVHLAKGRAEVRGLDEALRSPGR